MIGSRLAYTLAMVAAVVVSGVLVRARTKESSLTNLQRLVISLCGFIGAVFFAKLPFLFDGALRHGVWLTWFADGKTILWGLVGGYAGVELGKYALMVQTRTGDDYVVPVAVAIGIGRVGCFLYGCCYGVVTGAPWAMSFAGAPDGGLSHRHPTQLYELCFHFGFALLAATAIDRGVGRTLWMMIYLIAYAAFRFFTEWLRDEPVMWLGLTFYQWSSVFIEMLFTFLLIRRIRESRLA
ncbi:MAG: prolipoprotein diacylglyceryl transferase family protein [Planctomycetota bacterium]